MHGRAVLLHEFKIFFISQNPAQIQFDFQGNGMRAGIGFYTQQLRKSAIKSKALRMSVRPLRFFYFIEKPGNMQQDIDKHYIQIAGSLKTAGYRILFYFLFLVFHAMAKLAPLNTRQEAFTSSG